MKITSRVEKKLFCLSQSCIYIKSRCVVTSELLSCPELSYILKGVEDDLSCSILYNVHLVKSISVSYSEITLELLNYLSHDNETMRT